MNKEFLNLDDKIKILYEFINDKYNDIDINKINYKDLLLDDIKISISDYEFYNEIKQNILDANFKVIFYDNDTIFIVRNSNLLNNDNNIMNTLIKINIYNNNDINEINSNINKDNQLSYILSSLVLSKKIQHLLLPIMNFDIKFKDIINILQSSGLQNIINYDDDTVCCMQIKEQFNETYLLHEYLIKNEEHLMNILKPLLFQLIYSLIIIHRELSLSFLEFSIQNLLIVTNHSIKEYNGFKNDIFRLYDCDFIIKLIKFEKMINSSDNNLNKIINDLLNDIITLLPSYTEDINNIKQELFISSIPIYMLYNNLFFEYLNDNNASNNAGNNADYKPDKLVRKQFKNKQKIQKVQKAQKGGSDEIPLLQPLIRGVMPSNPEIKIRPILNVYKEKGDPTIPKENKRIIYEKKQLKKPDDPFNVIHPDNNKLKEAKEAKEGKEAKDTKESKNAKIDSDEIIEDVPLNKSTDNKYSHELRNKQDDNERYPSHSNYMHKDPYLSAEQAVRKDNIELRHKRFDDKERQDNRDRQDSYRYPTRTSDDAQVLMEQRMYNMPQQPYSQQKSKFKEEYLPMYYPVHERDPTGTMPLMTSPYPSFPVQKIYKVNFNDKFSNFGELNRIYEDYLPGERRYFTATTIKERQNLMIYMCNSILKKEDGEVMRLTGSNDVILSYIKIIKLNPYHPKLNPFDTLAKNFLLYSAAYPIKYNMSTMKIEIGNPAMGINVRIYPLTYNEIKHLSIFNNNEYNYDSNVFREFYYYYSIIKNKIISQKVSPNFISPILYKRDTQCKINWVELNKIISNKTTRESLFNNISSTTSELIKFEKLSYFDILYKADPITGQILKDEMLNSILDIFKKPNKYIVTIRNNPGITTTIYFNYDEYLKCINVYEYGYSTPEPLQYLDLDQQGTAYHANILLPSKKQISVIINNYNDALHHIRINTTTIIKVISPTRLLIKPLEHGNHLSPTALILLTEAPTQSLESWCQIHREEFGNILQMTSSGFYSENIWYVIIFQLIYIFAVLQKLEIYIPTLSLKNNFFIKDLAVNANRTGAWLYTIKNISYYIPNYGYILMFDSIYSDITTQHSQLSYKKIMSTAFNDSQPLNSFSSLIAKQLYELLEPTSFKAFIQDNLVCPLHDSIYGLITNIYNFILSETNGTNFNNFNIESILSSNRLFFRQFIHNRVGAFLTLQEQQNCINLEISVGQLAVHNAGVNIYNWVWVCSKNNLANTCTCITRNRIETPYNLHVIDIPIAQLQIFISNETIQPIMNKELNYDPANILESYIFENMPINIIV